MAEVAHESDFIPDRPHQKKKKHYSDDLSKMLHGNSLGTSEQEVSHTYSHTQEVYEL